MGTKPRRERTHPKEKTPTFLLELPLAVEAGQAARLRQMRAEPIQPRPGGPRHPPDTHAGAQNCLLGPAQALRVSWLAEHLDAVLAQTRATRAYQALNRICVGVARRVRFKSRGRRRIRSLLLRASILCFHALSLERVTRLAASSKGVCSQAPL